jgi:diguanylate cyclase (GGDEF)-like protein/PAS domain S-box-containing protein
MKRVSSALKALPFQSQLPPWSKLLLVALGLAGYFALYHFLPEALTSAITISSLLPIALGAYFYGIPGALIAGVLVFPLTVLSLMLKGETEIFTVPRLVIIPVVLLSSFLAGMVRRVLTKSLYDQELLRIGSLAAQEGLWDYHVLSEEVYYSPRYYTLLGYKDKELPYTFDTFTSLIHPDDLQKTLDSVEAITTNEQDSFSNTFRMKHKDGSWRWILSRGIVAEKSEDGTITRMVGVHSDISELKQTQSMMEFQAYHDGLTGLYNRKAFYDICAQLFSTLDREGDTPQAAVVMLDIDDFKSINDTLGHKVGDDLIQFTAKHLKTVLRKSDILCRWGGDEFIMVLNNLARKSDAALVATKVAQIFKDTLDISGFKIQSGVSLGISMYGDDGVEISELVKNADTAMYVAKKNKEIYRFFESKMHIEATTRMNMVFKMKQALKHGEFRMHYQPIVDRDGRISGTEALIRWFPEDGKAVSPGVFIPLAEETGFITEIGQFVLKKSIENLAQGNALNPDMQMAVNISPVQLRSPAFFGFLEKEVQASGINPRNLVLELTENSFLDYHGQTKTNVKKLIALGLSFAIDDFGTGFSTLSYLKDLPIAKIKVDQSFVRELPHNQQDSAIVKSILTLSWGLGKQVVMEGVETSDQLAYFQSNANVYFQGYYFSRPVPWEEIILDGVYPLKAQV